MDNQLKVIAIMAVLVCAPGRAQNEVPIMSWGALMQAQSQCTDQGCWHHWHYQQAPDGEQLMALLTALAEHTDHPLALEDDPALQRLSIYLPAEPSVAQGANSASSCLASACAAYEAIAPKSR
ncbi:hypothetical protein KUV89_07345 [Marinobacter hydrocarbonoclasticus]|nr:hypothetical protein [Marinobacter nauticus]